jgi:monoamine oxidase
MKAFFVYDESLCRADGFNGQLISDVGPARMSNDTCIPGDDHGVILLFSKATRRGRSGACLSPTAGRR